MMVEYLNHVYITVVAGGQIVVSSEPKEGYSKIELESPIVFTMGWGIEDFHHRAEILEEDSNLLYDRSKFKEALHSMVNNHDATVGITWDTIDYWLDEMCRLEREL